MEVKYYLQDQRQEMLSFQDQSFEVTVAPARAAYFFKSGSIEGFRRAIQEATTRWGGMTEPIIPVGKGGVIDPKWLQILKYAQVDGGVNVDLEAEDAKELAKQLVDFKLKLIDIDHIHTEQPLSATCYPMAVSDKKLIYNSRGEPVQTPYPDTKIIASLSGELWEAVAVGDLTEEALSSFQPSDDNRFFVKRSSIDPPILESSPVYRAQLNTSSINSLLNSTLSQPYFNFNNLSHISAIIWVTKPNSLKDCLEFWNIRALRPSVSIEMLIIPEDYGDSGKGSSLFYTELKILLNSHKSFKAQDPTFPIPVAEVIFYSNEVPEEKIDCIAKNLGLSKQEDRSKEEYFSQSVFTYAIASPFNYFKFERNYGQRRDVRTSSFSDPVLIEFSNPIHYFGPGKLLIGIKGNLLDYLPQRDSIARFFHPEASWAKGRLQLQQDFQNSYEIRLSLPTEAEIVRALLDEKTSTHSPSTPGKQAASLAEKITFEQILIPGLYEIIRKLTTPRSETLAKQLKKAQKQGEEEEARTLQQIMDIYGGSIKRNYQTAERIKELIISSQSKIKTTPNGILSVLEILTGLELAERGLEIKCNRCMTSSFIELSDTRKKPICPACGDRQSYKQNGKSLEVFYRLNAFVDLCSDQGVIPHLLVAGALNKIDPKSYLFMGENIHFKDGLEQEIDIFGIYQGKVIGGEVKTSSSGFDNSQIERDIELSKRLGVDVHLMACLEELPEETKELGKEINKSQGYNLELCFLDSNDFWPLVD